MCSYKTFKVGRPRIQHMPFLCMFHMLRGFAGDKIVSMAPMNSEKIKVDENYFVYARASFPEPSSQDKHARGAGIAARRGNRKLYDSDVRHTGSHGDPKFALEMARVRVEGRELTMGSTQVHGKQL